ncbi:hypothetical protein SI65_03927 [Aspergillus cristatus]|uniref:Chromo domain-containing protein n=1 Tax=Aspergillus cristatus TaxID=573508 RepID=A0A1E3BIV0_ASPCR|nr:hypothetical protein SI65_03927 [Aspergillus cristatus]
MLPSETTKASPFLIDCGYESRTSFDWKLMAARLPHDEQISRQRAQDAAKSMEEIWTVLTLMWVTSQMAGPFLILEKLQQVADDPLPGQISEPLEPIVVADEQEWEVEEVLASHLYQCRLQYQVKWIRFDKDLMWYPAANFKGSPHRIHDYQNDQDHLVAYRNGYEHGRMKSMIWRPPP